MTPEPKQFAVVRRWKNAANKDAVQTLEYFSSFEEAEEYRQTLERSHYYVNEVETWIPPT